LNNKILFLTKTSKFAFSGKIDIILSPELYWVRAFDIPIKSNKDVLGVLPSFFEDFLDVEQYNFYVIDKEDNKKLCFAYNEDLISKAIKNSGLTLNQVSKIYFAQNECKSFIQNNQTNTNSFKINNDYFLYQDEILLKVPAEFTNQNEIVEYNFDNIKLSKDKIYINTTNIYIDNKSLYIISILLLIVSFINFGKTSLINKDINDIASNKEKNKKQYNLPATSIQAKSIIKSLERKQNNQIKLREDLERFFNSNKKNLKRIYLRNGNINYE